MCVTVNRALFALAAMSLVAFESSATFHFMQIEQIITSVNGDASAQAIQLRMRTSGQNEVSGVSLKAYDATGANPVTLITFGADVLSGTDGAHILVATANFASLVSPAVQPDFLLTNTIPSSYFAAGRLTYEGLGDVLWSVSWGGAGYTGSNNGVATNDADGNFGPPYALALPSGNVYPDAAHAVRFSDVASALSSSNLIDYLLQSGEPTVTNNAGSAGTVTGGTRSLTVTAPTSGTSVVANQSFVIKWNSTGNLSSKVRVQLFKGSNNIATITTKTLNDGKLRWTVPTGLENDNSYRIRILNKATGTSDKSDPFTISSP